MQLGTTSLGRAAAVSILASAMLAASFGRGHAAAGTIQWMGDTARCYDGGVFGKKPIVILFYDKVTGRVDGDVVATRMSLDPGLQSLASSAVWCFADVSSDIVARNIGKALKIDKMPAVSVLVPNGEKIDEYARATGMSARVGSGDAEGLQFIARGVERVMGEISR